MFSELAVAYLFFGGAGAGACVVLGVLECANIGRYGALPSGSGAGMMRARSSRWARRLRVPHELLARGWVLCLLLLGTGSLCLLADAGRPERVVTLWLAPRFSVVTVGAWALLASSVVAAFFAMASNGWGARLRPALVLAAAIAAVVAGLVTAVYTGVLLGSLPSVLAYRMGVLPALFLLSSLSCGAAVVFAVSSLVDSRLPFGSALRRLGRADRAIILVEAALLVLFVGGQLADEGTKAGAAALIFGDGAVLFWVVLVLVGLGAPFVLEWRYPAGDRRVKGLWIAFCILLGAAALRVSVTGLAAFDISQTPELAFQLAAATASG
ncbi:NrfD/PsrC family molybdoenzyme membrane anchor subunit [Adlercreutzia shanghongiae]|uniref:NrfD/PsrC family molybdoenzyme membrane anchor subunit n=1 Tax=Adlercreutzia shanghongiae TaxID=3111773 RepID=A0ABU6IZT0_9ACTN|nr:NrfD/PsrC family molybdoenzyme membrane anchor subunit [Adlercreutzia sp. R22]MEC4294999.1 NrfD/PsrC family molybdoenzyme membrane anchor subunit [Adlercreutzia sp. R22]